MDSERHTDVEKGPVDVDPILIHLMRNARSSAVQKEVLRVPSSSFTREHPLKLLVGFHSSGYHRTCGSQIESPNGTRVCCA